MGLLEPRFLEEGHCEAGTQCSEKEATSWCGRRGCGEFVSGRAGRSWEMGPTVVAEGKGLLLLMPTGNSKTGKSKSFRPPPAFQSPFSALDPWHLPGTQLGKEK